MNHGSTMHSTPTTLTIEQRQSLDHLVEDLAGVEFVSAFTGAGISTESGIPDYRGPNGRWKKISPTLFRDFVNDPEIRLRHWQRRQERYTGMSSVQPNAGHQALSRMQRAGVIGPIITQNIDGLHQKAGSDPDAIIELHGSVHRVRCLNCKRLFPAETFDAAFDGTEPVCPVCGGIVKESTISFGEPLVEDDLRLALAIARQSEIMIIVGSSLSVNPAAKIPLEAARAGSRLAIINNEPTPLDSQATYVVHGPAGVALTYLADRLDAQS